MSRIYVELMGGLGNQLFQFSKAVSLVGLEAACKGYFFTRRFRSDNKKFTPRKLSISRLIETWGLNSGNLFLELIRQYVRFRKMTLGLFRKPYPSDIVVCSNFRHIFHRKLSTQSHNQDCAHIYIDGYFQDSSTLMPIRNTICAVVNSSASLPIDALSSKIIDSSAMIHVRRTDFVHQKLALDSEYYFEALENLQKRYEISRIDVYSDDEAWCQSAFGSISGIRIVGTDHVDPLDLLTQMSRYKYKILSLSTFSWWSYFLGSNNQVIFVPSQWNSKYPNLSFNDCEVHLLNGKT